MKKNNSQMTLSIRNLMQEVNSFKRMANSDGMDKCFEFLKKKYSEFKVHEFQPGYKAGDWTVPKQWSCDYSYLKDDKGRLIASTKDCHLFVSPNSINVNKKKIKGSTIIKNSISSKKFPYSYLLNHKHTYDYRLRQKAWGLTLPYKKLLKINKNKNYHLCINSKMNNNSMKVGEFFIKGKSSKIICIAAHIDELCNDNLSGSVASIALYDVLKKKKNFFSYQILLFPELYGPIFYIKRFKRKIKKTLFMLNLETVGAGKNWCLKKSLKSNSFLENCLRLSFKKNNKKFKELNFFDGYTNDEKVYAWPKIDIPGIAIQKYPYKYYHTDLDTLDKINYESIADSVIISYDMLNIFEKNYYILKKNYIPALNYDLPPWLTKKKLYISGKNSFYPQNFNNNLYNEKLLFSIDGKTSLYSLASNLNLKFMDCYNFLEKFFNMKILKKIKIDGKYLLR